MTKQHMRSFLYSTALAAACLGWWHESCEAGRFQSRLSQIERHLNQADIRITALSLAMLYSLSGSEDSRPGSRRSRD